jgi:hypothetical protein
MGPFLVEPDVGALPIRFGMTPKEVADQLGPPIAVLPDSGGTRIEERPNLMVGYSPTDGTMFEAVFWPGAQLFFRRENLLEIPDPISYLRQFDPTPVKCLGSIVFRGLGIRLSGFHDGDESQQAIGVAPKRHWDKYSDDFVSFND